MKTVLKKASALTLLLVLLIGTLALPSCKKEPLVIYDSDTTIVIKCEGGDGNTTLIEYMDKLKEEEELEFTVENGMIKSINGIQNAAPSYWMLYTSDSEMSNSMWGTVIYDGVEYGSATLGAESLNIKEGCLYIWVFGEMSW